MTLFEELDVTERELAQLRGEVQQCERRLRLLLERRYDCNHTFSSPFKGYEHEGGYCTKCGINEVHAESQKIGLKYK